MAIPNAPFNSMYGNNFNPYTDYNAMQNYPSNGLGYNMQNNMYNNMNQGNMNQRQNGVIPGKMVESFDVFRSLDIPFDGNVYYFPKADGTEVYTKRWLANGTTEQMVYKLVQSEGDEQQKPDPVIERLNSIEQRLNDFIAMFTSPVDKKEESK